MQQHLRHLTLLCIDILAAGLAVAVASVLLTLLHGSMPASLHHVCCRPALRPAHHHLTLQQADYNTADAVGTAEPAIMRHVFFFAAQS